VHQHQVQLLQPQVLQALLAGVYSNSAADTREPLRVLLSTLPLLLLVHLSIAAFHHLASPGLWCVFQTLLVINQLYAKTPAYSRCYTPPLQLLLLWVLPHP
jgi:hypothetical protein